MSIVSVNTHTKQSTPAVLNAATITTGAYLQLIAAIAADCGSIVVSNSGSQALGLGMGAAGSEVDTGVIIPPGCTGLLLPVSFKAKTRLAVICLGTASQTTGVVTAAFLF